MSTAEILAPLKPLSRERGGRFRVVVGQFGAGAGPSYADFVRLKSLGDGEEIVGFVMRSLSAGNRTINPMSIDPMFIEWAISNCSVPLLDALFREDRLPLNERIPRSSDGLTFTPLSLSVQLDSGAAVEYFITRGADLGAPGTQKMTALHYAAEKNRATLCLALIQAGAAVDSRDMYGQTPLFVAGAWGQLEAFVVLHKAGARLDIGNNVGTEVWCCRTYRPSIDAYLRSCEIRERLLGARRQPRFGCPHS